MSSTKIDPRLTNVTTMNWLTMKSWLDGKIDNLDVKVSHVRVNIASAHLAADYIFERLKTIELELDKSTEEADDKGIYIHDALQGMQNDVKHLDPDELILLEDWEAGEYVTTPLEQIRAMQKVKIEIDRRIKDAVDQKAKAEKAEAEKAEAEKAEAEMAQKEVGKSSNTERSEVGAEESPETDKAKKRSRTRRRRNP
ncbi:uncharacterized protein CLAFUR5_04790 [Fulvia fulva]|uniref:Uncharacterized protein n=1 Tax=Passalora fulva TaxID=5499 RepID=A0A9Q8P854_PASFU|nr:uncharacterized protein CLAFUR5_04790 [Fulvia fulva]UJO16741.1 hypothetical protein CLAFUR5_04790 [Fulvia fulva]